MYQNIAAVAMGRLESDVSLRLSVCEPGLLAWLSVLAAERHDLGWCWADLLLL